MEPLTKADLKEFFAEIRGELKQSIKESIAEAFDTWKPTVDLLQQQVRVKGNSAEEASAADPLDPLARKVSMTPPTTTCGVIPVLDAAAASDRIVDDKAASATAAANFVVPNDRATPAIVERAPEIVLPASIGFITTAPATCSMEGLRCYTAESRSAPTPTTAHTVHKTLVDIGPVLAAPAARDGTINDQAVNGVASTPTTCLTVCIPRHPVAASVLVTSSPPTSNEYVLDTNNSRVATVPLAAMGDSPAVLTPATFTPQLYNDSEFFKPISSQSITSKVPIHRPMPWPPFMGVHADGDEARPLPWPSFRFSVTAFYAMVRSHELKLVSIGSAFVRMIVASFLERQKNSHMLLLSWVWEQEELHLGFQFQMCSILSDWYLGNQSIMGMVCPDYSVKYNLLADTWSSWLLCVRPVCATADAAVLPDGQHSRNWHNGQPGVARDPLLFIIQSAVLNYMENCWVRTVIVAGIVSIFSAWIPVQMEVPHMQQLRWFSISVFSVYNTLLSEITEFQQSNLLYYDQASKIHPVAMLELQGSTYNNIPYASHSSDDEHALEPFLKQECVDISFSSILNMCTDMRMKKSEGSGELIECLANNLLGAYQIWLVAWTLYVFELSTSCGQVPCQGGRDVIRAAFSDQVHFNNDCYIAFINHIPVDSYNYLNQALYFDTVSTDFIYYSEDSPEDSIKSKELHVPWDPGKLVLQDHRKLRLEDKPSFKEGGVLASLPIYPLLGWHRWAEPRY